MKFRDWATRVILIFLMLATLILAVFLGGARQRQDQTIASTTKTTWNQSTQLQPAIKRKEKQDFIPSPAKVYDINPLYITTRDFANYRPPLAQFKVDPSNYGDRYTTDVNGIPYNNQAIIVLHETTNSFKHPMMMKVFRPVIMP